ncbi:glycoside hydrolase family 3 N-terminal domain-containing protein [Pseudogemmobacter sp. W21_MBD1_M6]|uniref:glycoside hydrolase family 3 N-terminal domain-containing protein n=1 Tax=Pseudogemmobacter sp. W21_MBD1_M6 TaxID=3240271 RepID=UPI003F9B3F3A
MVRAAAILGCSGSGLGQDEAAFFKEVKPLGFILFARNIETPDQTRRLTDALRDAVGFDAPILVDQEGGRVQRLGPPHWRGWLPPLDQMQALNKVDARRAMWIRYRLIADELRAVGIDSNCAPMADIARDNTHPFLKNRCYGTTLKGVVKAARDVADGLLAGGVIPVLKHIPGHGRAQLDSHKALPVVTEDRAALEAQDFAAFKALNDLPMGMTAHLVYDAIDPDFPATTSPIMIELIRKKIGFDGLLMTDDISMEALTGTVAHRAEAAIRAGCDVVLHCNGDLGDMQSVIRGAGRMADRAMVRAARAIAVRSDVVPADIPGLTAEFAALMEGRGNG